MTIYHINPKGKLNWKIKPYAYFMSIETISGILSDIQRSQEDLLRKRALRMSSFKYYYSDLTNWLGFSGFLCSRIATLDETDLSKDIEEHLVKTCKDVRNRFFCFF